MRFFELLLIALSLSMDAFAVSVCLGLREVRPSVRLIFSAAGFFGGFQAFMPLIGWSLGRQFERCVLDAGRWLGFFLLTAIGAKMVRDAARPGAEPPPCRTKRVNYRALTALAAATSIDALAVGVTFAFLQVKILSACALIGTATFSLCALGVRLGSRFGERNRRRAGAAGGAALMLIGLKILLEQ